MSTTSANAAKPAIVAASTPNDVIRVMTEDQGLRTTILSAFGALIGGDKGLLQTRTFWVALFTPIVGALAARYAAGLDGAAVGAITTILTSGAMIVMRILTTTRVTGWSQPAPTP